MTYLRITPTWHRINLNFNGRSLTFFARTRAEVFAKAAAYGRAE